MLNKWCPTPNNSTEVGLSEHSVQFGLFDIQNVYWMNEPGNIGKPTVIKYILQKNFNFPFPSWQNLSNVYACKKNPWLHFFESFHILVCKSFRNLIIAFTDLLNWNKKPGFLHFCFCPEETSRLLSLTFTFTPNTLRLNLVHLQTAKAAITCCVRTPRSDLHGANLNCSYLSYQVSFTCFFRFIFNSNLTDWQFLRSVNLHKDPKCIKIPETIRFCYTLAAM